MATLTLLPNLEVIFNVDHSVGKNGRNHNRADVQLVQYLLNLILVRPALLRHLPGLSPPKPLVTNGICTRETNDAILWFQKAMNSFFGPTLAEDGTVNNADNTRYGTIHKTRYTIYMLNWYLSKDSHFPLQAGDIPLQPLRSELEKGLRKSGNMVRYLANP
jgi:hypothetical protein